MDYIDPVTGAIVAVLVAGVAVWQRRTAILVWLGICDD